MSLFLGGSKASLSSGATPASPYTFTMVGNSLGFNRSVFSTHYLTPDTTIKGALIESIKMLNPALDVYLLVLTIPGGGSTDPSFVDSISIGGSTFNTAGASTNIYGINWYWPIGDPDFFENASTGMSVTITYT